jgi:hypothetical protein
MRHLDDAAWRHESAHEHEVVESGFWPWNGGHASGHGAEKAQRQASGQREGPLLATETRDATIVPRELRLFCPDGGKKRGGGMQSTQASSTGSSQVHVQSDGFLCQSIHVGQSFGSSINIGNGRL